MKGKRLELHGQHCLGQLLELQHCCLCFSLKGASMS